MKIELNFIGQMFGIEWNSAIQKTDANSTVRIFCQANSFMEKCIKFLVMARNCYSNVF